VIGITKFITVLITIKLFLDVIEVFIRGVKVTRVLLVSDRFSESVLVLKELVKQDKSVNA
jgi:hypothetical protein